MKKVVVLATFLAAIYAPSAFATAELRLTSGASSVHIVDGSVVPLETDTCGVSDCVTFSGSVGSWKINVTTGIEGTTPFFDLSSVNATDKQADPISISFSDDGLDLSLANTGTVNVGGTASTNKPGLETITFAAYTDTVKFGTTHAVGSPLVFHGTPFSGSSTGSITKTDTAMTLTSTIDLTKGAKGTVSFDAAVDVSFVPEPASITMLGGVLLILGGALRRGMKKA